MSLPLCLLQLRQLRGCLEIFLHAPNLSFWNLTASFFLKIARYFSQKFFVRTPKSCFWRANTKFKTASKGQVICMGGAPMLQADDVIDFKGEECILCVKQAIFTLMVGTGHDQASE